MKKTLLATAAALALVAGSALAQKQEAPAEKSEAPQKAPSAQQKAPAEKSAPGKRSGADSGSKAGQKSETTGQGAQPSPRAGQDGQQQPRAAQPSDRQQPGAQPQQRQQGAQSPTQQRQQGAQTGDKPSGEAAGRTGGDVTLTAEQKTKIRTTVIQSKTAPKVANVNFSLTVGTAVPKTVKVVTLPPTLIEIYPRWRGYLYFIVGERIVIVEPKSLKIVAVLVV